MPSFRAISSLLRSFLEKLSVYDFYPHGIFILYGTNKYGTNKFKLFQIIVNLYV